MGGCWSRLVAHGQGRSPSRDPIERPTFCGGLLNCFPSLRSLQMITELSASTSVVAFVVFLFRLHPAALAIFPTASCDAGLIFICRAVAQRDLVNAARSTVCCVNRGFLLGASKDACVAVGNVTDRLAGPAKPAKARKGGVKEKLTAKKKKDRNPRSHNKHQSNRTGVTF